MGELRRKAERVVLEGTRDAAWRGLDYEQLLRELCIHQVELEIQNEELQRLQLELERERDRPRELDDSLPVALMVLDQRGRIKEVNHRATKMFGASEVDLIDRPLSAWMDQEDAEHLHLHLARAFEHEGGNQTEVTLRRPDGALVPVRLDSVIRRSDGHRSCLTSFVDVSERKRIEDDSRSREGQLRTIVDSVLEGIITFGADGRIDWVNRSAASMFGYTGQELVGCGIEVLIGGPCVGGHKGEGVATRKDGATFPIDLEVKEIAGGDHVEFVGILRDLTEQKQRDGDLTEAVNSFRQITDHIEDVFCIVDVPTCRLLYLSPAFEQVFGHRADELFSAPSAWLEWMHPDDRPRAIRGLTALLRGEALDLEYRIIRPDRTVRIMRTKAYLAASKNRAAGVTIDITDERRLEEELARAQRMEAIGELASGIAHDFNNLLMGIAGFATIAVKRLDSSHPAHSIVNRIVDVVGRGKTLTRRLLEFSRKRPSERTNLDLDAAVSSCGPLLETLVGEHIEVVLHTEALGCRVQADAGEIEQILMNLAANARDAMPNGGTLELSTRETSLRIDDSSGLRKGRYAELIVRDTGTGMDEATLARAFEPFFTTKGIGNGTGLGLSNIVSIVKRMGGRVSVQSRVGFGTTVIVVIPVLPETSDLEIVPADASTRGIVLVVEDDPLVRTTVTNYLENLGYRALPAGSPGEAKRLVREYGDEIEVLLTDIILPHQVGRELAQELLELLPGLRVLYMSAHDREYLLAQSRIEPSSCLLQKPFDERALAMMLHKVLEQSRPTE